MDSSIEMAAACSLGILKKMKALISHGFDKDFLLDNSDRSYAVSCARGACFRFPFLKGKGKADGIFFR